MKKLIACLTICSLMCGCDEVSGTSDNKASDKLPSDIGVFYYKGHEYLYGYHLSITHSESCPCKEKEASK